MTSVLTSEREIGARLGLGRSAVKRLIEAGALAVTHVGGRTMLLERDAAAWLESQRPPIHRSSASAKELARWADDGGPFVPG